MAQLQGPHDHCIARGPFLERRCWSHLHGQQEVLLWYHLHIELDRHGPGRHHHVSFRLPLPLNPRDTETNEEPVNLRSGALPSASANSRSSSCAVMVVPRSLPLFPAATTRRCTTSLRPLHRPALRSPRQPTATLSSTPSRDGKEAKTGATMRGLPGTTTASSGAEDSVESVTANRDEVEWKAVRHDTEQSDPSDSSTFDILRHYI